MLASLTRVKAQIPSELGEPFYEGSVQRLYPVPEDDSLMIAETTSRGSVFDVGALFDIEGNDVNRALFRHVLYSRLGDPAVWERVKEAVQSDPGLSEAYRAELLSEDLELCCQNGANTHHVGMLDAETGELVRSGIPSHPSACNVVKRFHILKPERTRFLGSPLFDYGKFAHSDGFVVPLECIVRFGITSASSVFRKYTQMDAKAKAAFERELGCDGPLMAWQYLTHPISDFTSKHEPEDRMVSKQEALTMCGLSGAEFARIGRLSVLGAWVVRNLVEDLGLRLWDLKWEFAKSGDQLFFVDTIDTDSIRATLEQEWDGVRYAIHCNKQAMRDYFALLHADWIQAIAVAKDQGRKEGRAFTEILRARQSAGEAPKNPDVDPEFLTIQVEKMTAIRDSLAGMCSVTEAQKRLKASGQAELSFYAKRGKVEALRKINGIS